MAPPGKQAERRKAQKAAAASKEAEEKKKAKAEAKAEKKKDSEAVAEPVVDAATAPVEAAPSVVEAAPAELEEKQEDAPVAPTADVECAKVKAEEQQARPEEPTPAEEEHVSKEAAPAELEEKQEDAPAASAAVPPADVECTQAAEVSSDASSARQAALEHIRSEGSTKDSVASPAAESVSEQNAAPLEKEAAPEQLVAAVEKVSEAVVSSVDKAIITVEGEVEKLAAKAADTINEHADDSDFAAVLLKAEKAVEELAQAAAASAQDATEAAAAEGAAEAIEVASKLRKRDVVKKMLEKILPARALTCIEGED